MKPRINLTLGSLWRAYAGSRTSGRVECPVEVFQQGSATHIYRGYGVIRLERIGTLEARKGFQGEVVVQGPFSELITLTD